MRKFYVFFLLILGIFIVIGCNRRKIYNTKNFHFLSSNDTTLYGDGYIYLFEKQSKGVFKYTNILPWDTIMDVVRFDSQSGNLMSNGKLFWPPSKTKEPETFFGDYPGMQNLIYKEDTDADTKWYFLDVINFQNNHNKADIISGFLTVASTNNFIEKIIPFSIVEDTCIYFYEKISDHEYVMNSISKEIYKAFNNQIRIEINSQNYIFNRRRAELILVKKDVFDKKEDIRFKFNNEVVKNCLVIELKAISDQIELVLGDTTYHFSSNLQFLNKTINNPPYKEVCVINSLIE